MKRAKLAELLRKDHVHTIIMVIVTIVIVIFFWYGLKAVFRTEHPLLAVASGSMEPVLHKGDLILIQGAQNVFEIHTAPKDANPSGDIIVFHRPTYSSDLIVHRAVGNGTDSSYYLITQGDANAGQDGWRIREDDIVGKYTGVKVPLLGHIALFFEPLEVKVAFVLLWIVLLIILELIPLSKKKVEESQPATKPL